MSDIRDDELQIGEITDGSDDNQTIYAEPVRGAGAVKSLYNKNNRKRLYAVGGVGALLLVAVVYTFTSAEPPQMSGGVGEVQGGYVSGRDVPKRSKLDKEEADRYNNERLAIEQEEDPYAHPVIMTDVDDGEVSPFDESTDMRTPTRLSETGGTRSGNKQQASEEFDEEAFRSADDLARILIDGESAVPVLQKANWTYAVAAKTPSKGAEGADGDLNEGMSGSNSCTTKVARAGNMMMATMDLALNSDVGGPASLTINNGKLRGAKLIGSFERKEEWLRLELSKMVLPDETISVNAIGLDLDTTLNAVSGNVNRHLMYRYGWWGFGTVLSAVGKASAANANSNAYISDGVVTQSTAKDSAREIKMALGSMGEDIGEVMRERIERPITVTLKVGDEVGVFFLDDACLDDAK